jgi:DNA polymerase-3 subunit alpha
MHRERFMKGAVTNGVPSLKAEKIFDLMEKFGGYGFNKSHSAAYALIAYQTAYLKAHYPVEFMASLLTSEMHSTDGVVKYIAECRNNGIPVLSPDINESEMEFTVTGSQIRFGLVAVKNVGESAIESIVGARKEKPFESLFDFCERVDLRKVNKRVIESLIKCGAFDSTGDFRSKLMASLEDAVEYGQRIQKEKYDPQMGLFDIETSDHMINVPQYPDIEEWREKELLSFEKESLGFYITGHPLTRFEAVLDKFTNANTVSLQEVKDGAVVRIGGMVRSTKTIMTKKGEPMAFLTMEDKHGSIEITIFSTLYASAGDLLVEDNPILIQGQIEKDENSIKILADTVIPLEKAEETWTANIHLVLDVTRTKKDTLVKLRDILKKYPGSCEAYLDLNIPGKSEVIIALPPDIRLKPGPALTREVNSFLGYDAVETVCSDVRAPVNSNSYRGNNRKGKGYHGRS